MDDSLPRSVRVLREVNPDDENDAPAGRGASHGVINGVNMIEFLPDAVRGAKGMLLLAGQTTQIPIQLGAAIPEPNRGYSGALAIVVTAPAPDGFVAAPWQPGMPVTVWFSHPRGVHGF